jgi:hypothetical protein
MLDKRLLPILREVGRSTEREILWKKQCEKATDDQERRNDERDSICCLEPRHHII